ncbi:MAG: NYN domain-containing protein [Maricaulaceae bacterium]|jgi:uncharacterized LabA/DUF88 family protein
MTFYPNERIGVFIDGANFYSSAKGLGLEVDYKKLLDNFRTRGRLVRAVYYTSIIEEQDRFSPIRPLVDWLDYNGFTVITKPAKTFTDNQGNRRIRGDMDVDLAVDVLEAAAWLDHVVLFSGDGDFRRLVEAVQRKGVRVTVISTLKSSPPMASDDLRRQADEFIDLSELADMIGRQGGRASARDAEEDEDDDEALVDDYDS